MNDKFWVNYAKLTKQKFVEQDDRGELLPTIAAVRDGKIIAELTAPVLDKKGGIIGASIALALYNPDEIVVLLDAHVYIGEKDESPEEYQKKFPNGMQHACDEENVCDTGLITDVLLVQKLIPATQEIQMLTVPYNYHGKGTAFRWLDGEEKYAAFSTFQRGGMEGTIPDSFKRVLTHKMPVDYAKFGIDYLEFNLKEITDNDDSNVKQSERPLQCSELSVQPDAADPDHSVDRHNPQPDDDGILGNDRVPATEDSESQGGNDRHQPVVCKT